MGRLTARALGTSLITMFALSCTADSATQVVLEPDAPEGVADLQVSAVGTDRVTLHWTQVSDGRGGAANYALRYGSPTVSWVDTVPDATVAGTAVGEPAAYTFTALSPGATYQFQLVTYRGTTEDDVVLGPLSNIAAATTVAEPAMVTSVTASPSSHRFTAIGASTQITATARDASGAVVAGAGLLWTSTSPLVVSVDNAGRITARAAGSASIVVRSICCNVADTVLATVDLPVQTVASVTATPSSYRFTAAGQTTQVTAVARDAAGAVVPGATFSWVSTNPSAVRVDSLGRMTAVSAGSALIIVATTACCTGADTVDASVQLAGPTVTASALAGNQVVDLTSNVSGGVAPYTYQWHAATTDPGSNPSAQTAIGGLTGATGRHAGLTNGTTYYYRLVVTDALGSRGVSPAVTATPQEPSGGGGNYPNQPAGLTLIGRSDGSVETASGRAFGIPDFGGWDMDPSAPSSHIEVVSDASNPTGSGRALRFTWTQATNPRSGNATANSFSGGPYRELYIMTRIYLEPGGWSGFGNKYFYIGAASGARHNSSSPTQFYSTRESGSTLRFINQNGGSTVLVNSSDGAPLGTNSNPLVTGRWLNIEYRLVAQSSSSVADGQVHVWVNGTRVGYSTGVRWVAPGDPVGFSGMEWYGDANTVTSTSYYRVGELYIAGRP